MAQRNQYNPQGPSIDSALRDSSPIPRQGNLRDNVDEVGSERRAILHDVERPASPSASMLSSEVEEISRSTTTQSQSANVARPQQRDNAGVASSEADSVGRDHGTSRSQSNRSSHGRWSYQPMPSMSSLEISRALPEHHPLQDFEALAERQNAIPSHRRDDRPRMPTARELADLPVVASMIPPKPKEQVENIIIVLHDKGGDEFSLRKFASLHLRPKDTACLLLRGVSAVAGKDKSYQWENNLDTYLKTSQLVLDEVISALLISKCNFPARKIILFGQGDGAIAALATYLAWERVEFGGIISVGGQLPPYFALPEDFQSKTAVLLLGGTLGMTTPVAKNRIEQSFSYVDSDLMEGKDDSLPRDEQLETLQDFFSHRLHEEEWTKPAVITFGEEIRV
jgi:predicted esterase